MSHHLAHHPPHHPAHLPSADAIDRIPGRAATSFTPVSHHPAAHTLTGSVGSGGLNRVSDVLAVQRLINKHRGRLHKIAEDGVVGPETIGAIAEIQGRTSHATYPDGRVDVGGPTWGYLNRVSGPPTGPTPHPPAAGRLQWPIHGPFTVTTQFGVRDRMHTDHAHDGIDLAAPAGTLVHAVQSDRVLHSGVASGYGHWVVVDHGLYTVIYGHVSGTGLPSPGTPVQPGDALGRIGQHEGHSSGPHLHLEVHRGGYNGSKVDPETLLPTRSGR